MPTARADDFDLDIRLAVIDSHSVTEYASGYTSSPWTTEAVCCTDNCCD